MKKNKFSLDQYIHCGEAKGMDVCNCVKRQGGNIAMGKGDHAKAYTSGGKFVESIPLGTLHTGILRSIVKTLLAAGFTFLAVYIYIECFA